MSSPLKIRQLTPAVGAVIEGVDLTKEITPKTKAEIEKALVKHGVIFFENQQALTPEKQRNFARLFGELHIHPFYPPASKEVPELIVLDTNTKNPPDSNNWHTDVTFIPTPPLGCVLRAVMLPPCGGDTCWASTAAAYKALSPPMREFVDKLTVVHDFVKGFPADRWTDPEEARKTIAANPPTTHPLVRVHPVSGEKGLFCGDFSSRINNLSKEESEVILNYLNAFVSKPEFIVRWHWKEGDVAFWDNRLTQHYAVADYLPNRRIMHRATILGDRPYGPALPKHE
ncbi:alpha-ketoglutarate-dependent taurine dioxygenase-like [Paramacrobiotus metropolitanus]|uniref:alpha-ketoglutarate-dependent taurine dioxygenase-like n=1 Tax=Paramacrobiotus metropolitanus TaxID=2943436 RepID=UPI002446215B|nr:alpha-ketoglutarate-dependent taurine dioxygenase-like [Paramacrobiotus metropolitanus]